MKNANVDVRFTTRSSTMRPPLAETRKRLSPVPVFPPMTRGLPEESRTAPAQELVDGPAGEPGLPGHGKRPERVGCESCQARVELGHHLEVADKRAELGGGAQLEPARLGETQGTVVAVGLRADDVPEGGVVSRSVKE